MFASFSSISFIVFLATTQSFFVSDALNYPQQASQQSMKLGTIIGNLGFYDEILSIILSPFIGAFSDYIGSKPLTIFGLCVIGASFLGFTSITNVDGSDTVYYHLIFWRLVFTVGATSSALMITTMLAEITTSGYQLTTFKADLRAWTQGIKQRLLKNQDSQIRLLEEEEAQESSAVPSKKNGVLTAMIGVSTGLGAIWAISVYLPLPTKLSGSYTTLVSKLAARNAIVRTYQLVATISFLTAVGLYWGLYNEKSKTRVFKKLVTFGRYKGMTNETPFDDSIYDQTPKENYLRSIQHGFRLSTVNPQIALAYYGSFVARSTTVATAVFIPLMIYNYYHNVTKQCASEDTGSGEMKKQCHEAYVLASILTGICQTVALLTAPLWGILTDSSKFSARMNMFRKKTHPSSIDEGEQTTATTTNQGAIKCLIAGAILGTWGCAGIAFAASTDKPLSAGKIWHVSLIGISQMGASLLSLSLITNQDVRNKGAVAGVYTLCGGVGVLVISKAGGWGMDHYHWIGLPFFVLGMFNVGLLIWGAWVLLFANQDALATFEDEGVLII
ncbi:hypothetical protein BABINDRAFT_162634 [Babjeviella inositovora NRRL Y-12698]|uniref:Major facilitator superfamily (MFS) profile domain-containing protein n=1 Tax=Babjeviella inositovora NRRL Y-12698 TaxID=984486 RepID=A0A1E3QLA3_9ASCO|nr:uncharacterized protein BABINDRAFT_162634 [Babjeviella inositovora NRRL Y-12698]ODQ78398.1 hypothetical protein BABINDRAFT_162634 [Babjeviella inositovora NRRL Y-12698]